MADSLEQLLQPTRERAFKASVLSDSVGYLYGHDVCPLLNALEAFNRHYLLEVNGDWGTPESSSTITVALHCCCDAEFDSGEAFTDHQFNAVEAAFTLNAIVDKP